MATNGAAVMEALADPSRRAIAEILLNGPRSVQSIAEALPLSRPAVSQHLKVLTLVGAVQARPEGTRRMYRLDPDGFEALQRYLQQFWAVTLADFAAAARQEKGSSHEPEHSDRTHGAQHRGRRGGPGPRL